MIDSRDADWECDSALCPVVAYNGNDRMCPVCGALGSSTVDDTAESSMAEDPSKG